MHSFRGKKRLWRSGRKINFLLAPSMSVRAIRTTCPGVRPRLARFGKDGHASIGGRCARKWRIHYNRVVIHRDCRHCLWAGCTRRSLGGACPLRWFHKVGALLAKALGSPGSSDTLEKAFWQSFALTSQLWARGTFSSDCWAKEPAWILATTQRKLEPTLP
jgi:hypothetical protein